MLERNKQEVDDTKNEGTNYMERIVQRKRKMWYERQIQKKLIEGWMKGASKREE